MPEGYFSLFHILILLFSATVFFGLPLLIVLLVARWMDKRHNRNLAERSSDAPSGKRF